MASFGRFVVFCRGTYLVFDDGKMEAGRLERAALWILSVCGYLLFILLRLPVD
jgi:hypothetical protein